MFLYIKPDIMKDSMGFWIYTKTFDSCIGIQTKYDDSFSILYDIVFCLYRCFACQYYMDIVIAMMWKIV